MKAKIYPLLCDCVDKGVTGGVRRAFKHQAAQPSEAVLSELHTQVYESVMNAICEAFEFDEFTKA